MFTGLSRTFSQHDGTRPFDSIPAASTTFPMKTRFSESMTVFDRFFSETVLFWQKRTGMPAKAQ